MILFLLTILFSNFSYSAEIENFKFDNEIKIENETLILNGLAVRKATIFNIKILAAGLYLTKKSSAAESIINSTSIKEIQIRFMKSLSSEKISNMWSEQLLKRCLKDCIALKEQATLLGKLMIDIKSGDSLNFTFFEDHVKVLLSNNNSEKIQGKTLPKALLSLWIGEKPLDENLKNGLLGITYKH
jgi:hypothetical protein